jgi:hypothetical protein
MTTQKPVNGKLRDTVVSIVPVAVLTWALTILTAGYLGIAKNIDAAFISSLVTSVLASYGISRAEKTNDKVK